MRTTLLLLLCAGCHSVGLPSGGDQQNGNPNGNPNGQPHQISSPEVIVTGVEPSEMVVDPSHHQLYWIENPESDGTRGVLRADNDGIDQQIVESGDIIEDLTVGAGSVFWFNQELNQVRGTALGTIAPTDIFATDYATALLGDSGGLYIADSPMIHRWTPDGNVSAVVTFPDPYSEAFGLALVDQVLYVSLIGGDPGGFDNFHLQRLVGGSLQQVADIPGMTIAGAAGAVYWQSQTAVGRFAVAQGSSTEIAPRGYGDSPGGRGALATDESFLYFADPGTASVQRASLSDGGITTIAMGQKRAYAVAVDDQFVYWFTQSDDLGVDGTIVRLAKP
jgi:hypothetical protein